MELVTTNVRIEKNLYKFLKEKAFAEGKSMAYLIREALLKTYHKRSTPDDKEFRQALSRIVAIGKGSKDSSSQHDQIYLRD